MSAIALALFTLTWEIGTEGRRVCFAEIGCLSMSYPWISRSRQVPEPLAPKELPVEVDFFSREIPDGLFKVDLTRAPIRSSRPTVIITHDHEDDGNVLWMRSLKDAYLEQVDANVLIMDWGSGTVGFQYDQASSNIRVLSKVAGKILRKMSEKHGLASKDFHLIGEGLGAHLLGYIGKDFPGLGRITGLDPSREFFEFQNSQIRLDKTDANFVDVIHTSTRLLMSNTGFGLDQPIGHVDFYVNIGEYQPGCEPPNSKKTGPLIWLNWGDYTISDWCNHKKARDYFLQAMWNVNDCTFFGYKREIDRLIGNFLGNLTIEKLQKLMLYAPLMCTPLGLKTVEHPAKGIFYIRTRNTSPYCMPDNSMPLAKPINIFHRMFNLASRVGRIGIHV